MPLITINARDLVDQVFEEPKFKELTEYQQSVLESSLQEILEQATHVASKQKEPSMPLHGFEILTMLRYARSREGVKVLPRQATNVITKAFLNELYDAGFWVTQYFVGEERAIFSPDGSQRLRLHWASA